METFFPFDAGAGANITEDQWSKMGELWAPPGPYSGLLSELLPFGDSTGMQVKLSSGRAYIRGHFYENDATLTMAIGANSSGNPRIDRLVVRLNKTTNAINALVIAGTPAASPVAPAMTQTSTIWDIPIADVAVANAAATITAANVTDRRELQTHPNTGWTSFTPTWASTGTQPSRGAGTFVGKYQRIGKLLHVRYHLILGAGFTTGTVAWYFLLPPGMVSASGARQILPVHYLLASHFHGMANIDGDQTALILLVDAGSAGGAMQFPATGIPAAWANGHSIVVEGVLEIV